MEVMVVGIDHMATNSSQSPEKRTTRLCRLEAPLFDSLLWYEYQVTVHLLDHTAALGVVGIVGFLRNSDSGSQNIWEIERCRERLEGRR
jgi:hypothetical protein